MEVSHGVNADFQDRKYTGLTEKIIRIFCRAYDRLGYGFFEKFYENAMATDIDVGLLFIVALSQGSNAKFGHL